MLRATRRRAAIAGGALAGALLGAVAPARAQPAPDWPDRPLRWVVPYAAGGPTDLIARILADALSQRLPQRVVVENRSGAGGAIGAGLVARAAADGATFLFTNNGHVVLRPLYLRLDFDPEGDFAAVSVIAESPMVLLVPPGAPWRTVAELVAAARAAPGRLTYGSTGGGGVLQLVSLLFLRAAGIRMQEVAYRGSGPAAQDLAAGRLDMLYDAGPTGFALARGGQARALVVSAPQRSPVMPEVPTVVEAGYPEATFAVFQVVLAPARTPAPVVERLSREIAAVLREPAIRARLAELGAERVVGGTPAEAAALMAREARRWAAILAETGAQPQR
ncbi:Bug family tripartite tricarboxylate transporter substrate binding protein [Caldovatus aquaticus]|uniref:Tripartite tricarboxylate transporter substrate binding protein n=1 Tax=Caldovatus aquaticus TaxID=2865671 RepID=A0ABS7F690_9PROT|nr:tripartite tricarboxylate transporter substrate binding protein [Caldovatus aquaticus]MBW8271140.1 tripartite tricarboxylate transporter substrate binding protein [Caldovatus aquaticus]